MIRQPYDTDLTDAQWLKIHTSNIPNPYFLIPKKKFVLTP